jgi:hypothetical protein
LLRQRPLIAFERFLIAPKRTQGIAAIVQRFRQHRFERQHAIILSQCGVMPVDVLQGEAEIERRLVGARPRLDRLRQHADRLDRLALGKLHDAQQVKRVEMAGIRPQRGSANFGCLVEPAGLVTLNGGPDRQHWYGLSRLSGLNSPGLNGLFCQPRPGRPLSDANGERRENEGRSD